MNATLTLAAAIAAPLYVAPLNADFAKWLQVQNAHEHAMLQCENKCLYARLLASLRPVPRARQPQAIDQAVNARIAYVSDQQQHNRSDVWSVPGETLAAGKGDCEDYAILKFYLARDLGLDARIVVGFLNPQSAHAVAYVGNQVLDNRPRKLDAFAPIYSIDTERWYLHGQETRQ